MSSLLQVTDRKIEDAIGQNGTYTGQVNVNTGLPQGKGTMKYNGDVNSDSSNDNATSVQEYQGEWQDGYWHGQGVCKLKNGDVYQGEFVQQERHGNGEYTWSTDAGSNKQRIYQGTFYHNQRHGHGKYTWRTRDDDNNKVISESTYVGMFDNGQRSGHGVYQSSAHKYNGDWQGGNYHGYGVLETSTSTYKGYFQYGRKHGKGVETLVEDGSVVHDGHWKNDQPISEEEAEAAKTAAAAAMPTGASTSSPTKAEKTTVVVLSQHEPVIDGQGREGLYKGMMQDYLPQGVGTIKYKQHPDFHLEYEGFWAKGMKHGFGRLTYMMGDSYQGNFVQNQKHGQGELRCADGRLFKGQFLNDLPDTTTAATSDESTSTVTVEKFRVVYPKNDLYWGDYEKGLRSGKGRFTWVDGGYYNGMWKEGLYEGPGELVTATTMYAGEFQKGSYHGTGTLTNLLNNQIIFQGEWKEGLPTTEQESEEIPNGFLIIPQPPLDYDVAQLLPQPSLEAYEAPKNQSLGKTLMSGLSSLVVGNKSNSNAQEVDDSALHKRPPSPSMPDILDKTACKAVVDMHVWDGQDNPGRYTGIIHVGSQRPHGVGRMVYDDGNRVHEGFWEYGHRQGHGRCLFVNIGDFHEGNYEQNLRDGPGTYYWKDGRLFVGTYEKDERHGPGVFTYPNGDVFDGNFEHGHRSGYGTFTFNRKSCQYQGQWQSGMYHGPGKLKWQSVKETRTVEVGRESIIRETCQHRYEGNFENGLFHGEGIEYQNDKIFRQGTWRNGKFIDPAQSNEVDDAVDEAIGQEAKSSQVPAHPADDVSVEKGTSDIASLEEESSPADKDSTERDDEVSDENEDPLANEALPPAIDVKGMSLSPTISLDSSI